MPDLDHTHIHLQFTNRLDGLNYREFFELTDNPSRSSAMWAHLRASHLKAIGLVEDQDPDYVDLWAAQGNRRDSYKTGYYSWNAKDNMYVYQPF